MSLRNFFRQLEPVLVFLVGYFVVESLFVAGFSDPLPVGPVYLPLSLVLLLVASILLVGGLNLIQWVDPPVRCWLPTVLALLALMVRSPGTDYVLEGYFVLYPLVALLGVEYVLASPPDQSVQEWGVILTLILVLPAQWIVDAQALVGTFTIAGLLNGIVMAIGLWMVLAAFRWSWVNFRSFYFGNRLLVAGILILALMVLAGIWTTTWQTPHRQAGLYDFQSRFDGIRPEARVAGGPNEDQRPSVVLVSIDTLRWDMVPPHMTSRDLPAFRQLGRDSTTFTRAFSSSGWTLPAHASLFTGLSPIEHGAVLPDNYIYELLPLYPQVFQDLGYATAGFTDGGYVSRVYGFQRGFDTLWEQVLPFSASPDERVLPGATNSLIGLRTALIGNPLTLKLNDSRKHRYFNRNVREAKTWWSNQSDRPKFLFLHTYQLHDYKDPYPENYRRLKENHPELARTLKGPDDSSPEQRTGGDTEFRARYRSAIRHLYEYGLEDVDRALGRFVNWLKDRGEYRNTLVVLVSDHGEGLQYKTDVEGHSGKLHEVLTRVPVWVKWPGNEPTGRVSELVQLRDVFPVIFEQLGIQVEGFSRERLGSSNFVVRNSVSVPDRSWVRSSVAWKVNSDTLSDQSKESRIEVRGEEYKVRSGTRRTARSYLSVSDASLTERKIPRTVVPPETASPLDAELRKVRALHRNFPNPFLRTNTEVDEAFRDRLRGLGYFQ